MPGASGGEAPPPAAATEGASGVGGEGWYSFGPLEPYAGEIPPDGMSFGVDQLTYRHQVEGDTDKADIEKLVRSAVDEANAIINEPPDSSTLDEQGLPAVGIQKLKSRVRRYMQPGLAKRLSKQATNWVFRNREISGAILDEGLVWPHRLDVSTGGYYDRVSATRSWRRSNSVIGGQFDQIQLQILAMDNNVSVLTGRINYSDGSFYEYSPAAVPGP